MSKRRKKYNKVNSFKSQIGKEVVKSLLSSSVDDFKKKIPETATIRDVVTIFAEPKIEPATVVRTNGINHYSDESKRKIVQEVADGLIRTIDANLKYGIKGHSTILKWSRKFEDLDSKLMKDYKHRGININERKTGENRLPNNVPLQANPRTKQVRDQPNPFKRIVKEILNFWS